MKIVCPNGRYGTLVVTFKQPSAGLSATENVDATAFEVIDGILYTWQENGQRDRIHQRFFPTESLNEWRWKDDR